MATLIYLSQNYSYYIRGDRSPLNTADHIRHFSASLVFNVQGGGPRVVVSTAAFHARVRGSVPGLGGLKETKNVSSPSTCESQYCGEPP